MFVVDNDNDFSAQLPVVFYLPLNFAVGAKSVIMISNDLTLQSANLTNPLLQTFELLPMSCEIVLLYRNVVLWYARIVRLLPISFRPTKVNTIILGLLY